MSLDAIKQITQVEEEIKQRKVEAVSAAKTLIADAEKAGKETLHTARTNAESKAKELLCQAKENSAVRAAKVAAQSKQECTALCHAAEEKLDEAAALIVRRVVNT